MEDMPSGSELLNLFPVCRVSGAAQIFFLEFGKDVLADLGDKFTDLFRQPAIDTARRCRFLQLSGVSLLLLVSIQLLRAS